MEKLDAIQKKKVLYNMLYASVVVVLIVMAALTVVLINNNNQDVVVDQPPNLNVENNTNQEVQVSTPSYVVPLKDATVVKDYSAKELQYNESLKQWEIHKAIDFLAGSSLDVLAFTDGTVSKVYTNYLEGTVIEIAHANGLVSVYKSLESANVKVGDKVSAGQIIGVLGNTMAQEQNAGNHLHFEVLKNGSKINPNEYLDLGSK